MDMTMTEIILQKMEKIRLSIAGSVLLSLRCSKYEGKFPYDSIV